AAHGTPPDRRTLRGCRLGARGRFQGQQPAQDRGLARRHRQAGAVHERRFHRRDCYRFAGSIARAYPEAGAGFERPRRGGAVAHRQSGPLHLRPGDLCMNAPSTAAAGRPALRPLDDALAELLAHAQPLAATETVSTFEADGRVLAQDLVSALQVPPQDNSSMDGYAVRSSEIAAEGVALPVSQRIPAGIAPAPLAPGSVARIFTGALIPAGADAVVMQEDTEAADTQVVRILRLPKPGQWIRRSGEDVMRGAVVLARGDRMSPAA